MLDAQFRPLLDEDDQALALRTSLAMSAEWPRWRLDAEVMDSRAELNDAGSTLNSTLINTVEPLELSVTRRWTGFGEPGSDMSLRAGRLTLDIGKRRLIARNQFRNVPNSFVGIDWQWRRGRGQTLRAFYLAPMLALPNVSRRALLDNEQQLDKAARNTILKGLYYGFPLRAKADSLELYLIDLDANEIFDRRDLRTLGLRIYRPPDEGHWHYEIEAMAQSGKSAALVGESLSFGLDHEARFAHVDLGFSFGKRWASSLTLLYDSASGDEDPFDAQNGRFDTLYGARSFELAPSGIYGPVARSNLETPGLSLAFAPLPRFSGELKYRVFRLESDRDAWTTTADRDVTGLAGGSLGAHLEAGFSWTALPERLGVDLGMAHFDKGRFVKQTAAARAAPSTYLHAAVTVWF